MATTKVPEIRDITRIERIGKVQMYCVIVMKTNVIIFVNEAIVKCTYLFCLKCDVIVKFCHCFH